MLFLIHTTETQAFMTFSSLSHNLSITNMLRVLLYANPMTLNALLSHNLKTTIIITSATIARSCGVEP